MQKKESAPPVPLSPWAIAWTVIAPLALWLLFAKGIVIANAAARYMGIGRPPDGTLLSAVLWFTTFAWVRLAILSAAGFVGARIFFPRRRWAGLGIFIVLLVAYAAAFALVKRDQSFAFGLVELFRRAAGQVGLFLTVAWRELATASLCALLLGFALQVAPRGLRRTLVAASQLGVVFWCALVSIDAVTELALGQPAHGHVLLFATAHAKDMIPLVLSEVTVLRAGIVVAGLAIPSVWAWVHRSLGQRAVDAPIEWMTPLSAVTAIGAVAVLAPSIPIGSLPLERYTNGTLVSFARTLSVGQAGEAKDKVSREFEITGKPRWHSANLKFLESESVHKKNVVVIMMESVRAISTTMHNPSLSTTPFLADLAKSSLLIEDMSAVVPRTAAAWVAILNGQYPMSNESAGRWLTDVKRTQPPIRGLVHALRDKGYATSFVTPTDLNLLGEYDLVKTFGFESIVTMWDLADDTITNTNYQGIADEVMVKPLLEWSDQQAKSGRPFMAAVMTNVGHHPYYTPSTWKKVSFDGVRDPTLEAYLNCLLYIDGVVGSIVKGYEQLGLAKDTVFVIVGDHGQLLGEHGQKQVFSALFQEGLHVPAMIHAPGLGIDPGRVTGPRSQVDFLPTIAQILGYRIDGAKLPGKSLLEESDPQRLQFFSSSIDSTQLGARRGSRKYIYKFDTAPLELYDLAKDPSESTPLSISQDEQSQVVEQMLEWREASELAMFSKPPGPAATSERWLRR